MDQRSKSRDEVHQEHIEILGLELGELFNALYYDLILLHVKWQEFKELFDKSSEQIKLLNQTAPFSFYLMQKIYLNDILLHITRLTDPPKSAGKPNLTLMCLPEEITDDELSNQVQKAIDLAKEQAKFARDWRNRTIAHKDLLLSLKSESAQPLTHARKEDVEKALEAIAEVMKIIYYHYFKSKVSFYPLVLHNANELVFYLEKGLEAVNQEKKQLLNKKHKRQD